MATVYGVVGEYVAIDYIDDQPDYVLGPVQLTFSGSASGSIVSGQIIQGDASVDLAFTTSATGTRRLSGTSSSDLTFTASASAKVPRIIYGGSVEWQTPDSWETWYNNEWNGGIDSNSSFSTSVTGTVQKNASATADLTVTTSATGGFLITGSTSTDLTFTTSASGTRGKFGSASADLTFTTFASGDDFDFGSATANLAFTTSASGDLFVGGTGVSNLTSSASGSAILVIRSVDATGNITFTPTASAGVIPGADPRRIYVVDSETRGFIVYKDTREITVKGETRIQKIYEES